MNAAAQVFTVAFIALWAGHQTGDHWVQTSGQAARKILPGWPGRIACAIHVATLTATKAACLAAAITVTGVPVTAWALAAGLAADALSHYWADRRVPGRRFTLQGLAGLLGSGGFWTLGQPRPGRDDNPVLGTGAYCLDQSWHALWLFIASLIIAVLR